MRTGIDIAASGIADGHILQPYFYPLFCRVAQHRLQFRRISRFFSGQSCDFHDTAGADAGAHGAGDEVDDGTEGTPQGTSHADQHGHGAVGDLPLPEAEDGKSIARIADDLPSQLGNNAADLLVLIAVQLDAHGFGLLVFIALKKGLHQAKGLDGLHILEDLLVEGDIFTGKFLVLFLVLPHSDQVVAGNQQGNRRAAEGNDRHDRIVLNHDNEGAAKAHQHGAKAREKGQNIVDDHAHVAVQAVLEIAGPKGRQGFPVGLDGLLEDIEANSGGDI